MNDSFQFVAPVMPRRKVDPFALRLAIAAAVCVLAVGLFARFLIDHERASFVTAPAVETAPAAAHVNETPLTNDAVFRAMDEEARTGLMSAADLAHETYQRTGSFTNAGAFQLTQLQPNLLYVDGSSTAPSVVSVDTTKHSWAAAAMGPSGSCYWIHVDAAGTIGYGTGTSCAGSDAMSAEARSW
jgi:hypothetical protein